MTRQTKILNLDDLIADTPQSAVTWSGEEHAVADMSVDTYLRYVAMEESLREQMANSTPAAQMQLYLEIFGLMVPTLPLDEIKKQPLQVVTKLAEFVMAAVAEMMSAGGDAGEQSDQPGE